MKYRVILQESEEGFAVSVPGLPGCHSQEATEREVLENVTDATREYVKALTEQLREANTREVEVEV
jgi:predicted RNase H-like HicB family nuclease